MDISHDGLSPAMNEFLEEKVRDNLTKIDEDVGLRQLNLTRKFHAEFAHVQLSGDALKDKLHRKPMLNYLPNKDKTSVQLGELVSDRSQRNENYDQNLDENPIVVSDDPLSLHGPMSIGKLFNVLVPMPAELQQSCVFDVLHRPGYFLIAAYMDGLWFIEEGGKPFKITGDVSSGFCMNSENSYLFVTSSEQRVRKYSLVGGKPKEVRGGFKVKDSTNIFGIACSENGRLAISDSLERVHIFTEEGRKVDEVKTIFDEMKVKPYRVAWLTDEVLCVKVRHVEDTSKWSTLCVNVSTKKLVWTFNNPRDPRLVTCISNKVYISHYGTTEITVLDGSSGHVVEESSIISPGRQAIKVLTKGSELEVLGFQ